AAQVGSTLARIQGRKELEDTEECYRALFEKSINPILVTDIDGKYLDGNDAALAFLECTREELLAMYVKDTLPPYLDEQWLQQYRELWERGGTVERDYYVWGKIKVMEMTVASVQLGEQQIVIGIGKDITERKKMEAALQKSEEKYRLHVNSVSDVIFSFDPELRVMDFSPSVERLLGYKPEELIGCQLAELNLLAPESLPAVKENLKTILAGGHIENTEYEVIAKDGMRKFVEINSAPLYSEDKIIGTVSVARDITDHKKIEQALIESESKYRSLVESAGVGVATVNMKGEISFVNEGYCRIIGYTKDELEGKLFADLIYPDDRATVFDIFTNAVKAGTATHHLEFRAVHKDGHEVWLHTNPTVMAINNEIAGFSAILHEITELKKTEEALRLSEEKFRDLADLAPQVVFEADKQGVFTYVNKRGYEVFGYGPGEIVDKLKASDVIIPEERETAMKNYFGILGGARSSGNEYTALRKDGGTFNVLAFSNAIIKNGEVVGLRGTYTNISRMKATEKALRDSEEKYRSLIENAGEAIFIAQDDKVVFANQRTLEIVHYERDEFFAKPFIEMIYPDDREIVYERYSKRIQGEPMVPAYDVRIIDKDGSVIWVELRATKIEWEGRPATLNFVTDITVRKQAEQSLKESEERYRLLADNALDVIWTADMQGHITYVSPSVRYIVGRSAEEIMNMYRSETLTVAVFGVTEEDRQRFLSGLKTLIRDASRTLSFEFGLKHSDGFTSWVEVKMSIMRDQNRQAAGILGIARDITQQKKMTERLISTDRLASLGEMAAGLAHEVNNPLTAVMGFAYLLQQNPNIPPEIRKDVEAIYHEGKRAADVIKSFLVFARGQKPERQAVYINDILDGMLRLRRSQMNEENIEVSAELAEDLPAVQGEVSQLQQAFLNIVLNAEYFMCKSNRGGHLKLSSSLEDGKIIVKIADDGPGIDPEKLNRVFDPFYTTKDVGEGTGLGLSICHGIIRGHGGEIYVESNPEKGTVFTVELPIGQ
ncbi:MAG: PAS domain S-box protein, partial [Dehalococcoidia bacterium]|nr:PAS domain S-box protein [Dehalococcoidia bacterium]